MTAPGRLAVAIACLAAAAPGRAGVIEGHVALPHRHGAPVLNQRYEIVARGGILATNPPLAVVYFEPAGRAPPSAPTTATAQMAQRGLAFAPALLAIQAGTRVFFPNEDDTYHNIFSYSPAKRFDLGRYRSDERPVPSVAFDRPGLVTLHCDIHEHMRALILIVDTPYFVVTDPDGHFRLPDLPAGAGRLEVWLDSRTVRTQEVAVPATGTLWRNLP